MNRKFLESLGLEKDVIDQVMAKHGATIEDVKAEVNELKDKLNQAKETNEELTYLSDQVEQLKADNESLSSEYKDLVINTSLKEAGGQDLDYLKFKLGEVEDLDKLNEMVEELKQDLPQHFKAQEVELEESEKAPENETEEEDVKEVPEGHRRGAGSLQPKGGESGLSVDDIMAIEDPEERKVKIAENLDKFK